MGTSHVAYRFMLARLTHPEDLQGTRKNLAEIAGFSTFAPNAFLLLNYSNPIPVPDEQNKRNRDLSAMLYINTDDVTAIISIRTQ